jgi:DNA-binding NtrC family response regulator
MKMRPVWKDTVIDFLMKRDKYVCELCGDFLAKGDIFELDHIKEKSKGGDDSFENLRAVHLACHKLRHKKIKQRVAENHHPVRRSPIVGTLRECLEQTEKSIIMQRLETYHGNITKTAEILAIARPSLYEKIKKYGIERK